jgi:MFS family permease
MRGFLSMSRLVPSARPWAYLSLGSYAGGLVMAFINGAALLHGDQPAWPNAPIVGLFVGVLFFIPLVWLEIVNDDVIAGRIHGSFEQREAVLKYRKRRPFFMVCMPVALLSLAAALVSPKESVWMLLFAALCMVTGAIAILSGLSIASAIMDLVLLRRGRPQEASPDDNQQ